MTPGQTDPLLARLEQENKRLGRAVEELSILNEVASAVTSTSSLDAIVDLIVEKCVKHLAVEQGAVLLLDRQEPSAPLRTLVRRVDSEFGSIPYRLGDQLTGWMLKHQAPLLINDLAGDGTFSQWRLGQALSLADVRSPQPEKAVNRGAYRLQ